MPTMRLEDVNKDIPKVPTETYIQASQFIQKHTLSLLKGSRSPNTPEQTAVVGTGSLIWIRDKYFLLTAGHVWAAFDGEAAIFISRIDSITHSSYLLKDALTPTTFVELGEETPWSPDLVLLEIPKPMATELETRHSFFAIALEKPEPAELQWQPDYIAMGTPGMLSEVEPDALYFEVRGFFCHPIEYEEQDDVDFVVIRPHQEELSDLKKVTDFGGMSGGGFWEVLYFTTEDGKIDFNLRFLGVVFWQDDGLLRCQGRKAIGSVVNRLAKPSVVSLKL